jgi:hypothetical protein
VIARLLAALACIALCACARSAPSAQTQTAAPSACALAGFWAFQGACITGDVGRDGGSIVLPKYRRMTVTMNFSKSDSAESVPFVFADATGDGDIAGKLNAKLDFPAYGSVACVTPRRLPAPCTGRAILYVLVINAGKHPVTYADTPMIAVGGTGTLDGLRACRLSTLVWIDPRRLQAAWVVRDYEAVMADLGMAFKPLGVRQTYGNRGAFTIFAITCS